MYVEIGIYVQLGITINYSVGAEIFRFILPCR